MSGRKPPRPLAQPVVPRPRREPEPEDLREVQPEVHAPPPPAPPPPEPAPAAEEPGGPRVLAGVLAALGVLALLAVTVFLVLSSDQFSPTADRGAGAAPEPPVDLAPRTTYVDTRITDEGDLVVRQWIHGSSAMFGVRLRPPESVAAVRVTDVLVVAGGRAAPGPDELRRGRGAFEFTGSTDVFLTYRIPGAVVRSDSVPGRALARFTSLDVRVRPPMIASTHAVSGVDVLALACAPDEPGAVPVPCGAPADDGWRVERTEDQRDDVVSAQLDLP